MSTKPDKKRQSRLKKMVDNPEKFDAKHLAKAAPELAAAIEERPRATGEYDTKLMRLKGQVMADLINAKVGQDARDIWLNINKGWWAGLALHAAPGQEPNQLALRNRLCKKMILLNQWNEKYNSEKGLESDRQGSVHMQWVFDKVIDGEKHNIVGVCFQGDEDSFREHCKAYKNKEEFNRIFFNLTKQSYEACGLENQMMLFQQAVNAMSIDVHKSWLICWKCGKKSTNYCTECLAAQYCCSECQRADWKTNHKSDCVFMKELYALFQGELKLVDEAFADPEDHEQKYGILPSLFDYAMVGWLTKAIMTIPPNGALPGPSMANFYSNVKLVGNDEIWSCSKITDEKDSSDEPDINLFQAIALAMLFDYSKLDDKLSRTELFRFIVAKFHTGKGTMKREQWLSKYRQGIQSQDPDNAAQNKERLLRHGAKVS